MTYGLGRDWLSRKNIWALSPSQSFDQCGKKEIREFLRGWKIRERDGSKIVGFFVMGQPLYSMVNCEELIDVLTDL